MLLGGPTAKVILALALLAAGGLAGGTVWWVRHGAARGPLDPTRHIVVFLGDSITAGDHVPVDTTFAYRLGVALGVPVRNAGISGDTTAGGLRRLKRDVLAYRPKLVVVELGINDALAEHRPVDQTLRTLDEIIQRLRRGGAGVVLIHIRLGEFGDRVYRRGFRRIAQREGAWLVEDFYGGLPAELLPDGLHPNAEGHARLAARLEPLLRDVLAR